MIDKKIEKKQDRFPKGTYKISYVYDNNIIHYCIVNLYTDQRYYSRSLWDIIMQIEDDILVNKYPQNTIQYRTWRNAGGDGRLKYTNLIVDSDYLNFCPIPDSVGPTFIVNVIAKQNATWQGTIQWIEGRQTRQYRSTNELLKLMDDAFDLFIDGEKGKLVQDSE